MIRDFFSISCRGAALQLVCISITCCVVDARVLPAQEPKSPTWGQFRGAKNTGRLANCDVPLPWQAEDVAWEASLPGKGNGAPSIFGDRIFLMSANADNATRYLQAFDVKNGHVLWTHAFPSEPYHLHARSSYASCTPCVDETAVYFAWATPKSLTLIALKHDGEELWKKDLGPYVSQHGFGASPVLFGDTLVLFNSQQAQELPSGAEPGVSRVMAFHAKSGQEKWVKPCTSTRACYGTPTMFRDSSGVDALLFSDTGEGMFAIDLETGTPLWNSRVFDKRCVSSPLVVGDLAIGTEGSGGGGNILFGVDIHGTHELKLKIDRSAPYVPTPVAHGELLFMWGDTGIVSCIRLPSGDVLWSKRIGGNVSASPVIAGEKLIGIAEDGTVTVLSASEKFHEFGNVKLEDTIRSTPALSEHFLLLRTDNRLICVGKP